MQLEGKETMGGSKRKEIIIFCIFSLLLTSLNINYLLLLNILMQFLESQCILRMFTAKYLPFGIIMYVYIHKQKKIN